MNRPPAMPHRVVITALVVALLAALAPGARAGQVTREDLAAAEAAEAEAAARLAAAREELAEAAALRDRLAATIESLTSRSETVSAAAVAEASAVRGRVTRMYMAAGRPDAIAAVEDVAGFLARLAYLSAIAESDRAAVNRFTLVIDDLEGLRDQAEAELAERAAGVAALELLAAARASEFDEATERVAEARRQWVAQEAARQAALEAELRRQEEELARQAATTTTTTVPGTTTTTAPPSGGYQYDPNGGVEQWRPLLTSIFTRWGLDREKCGPSGCLGSHVDDALTIMRCESRGIPFAVNPTSGTTGLFQHRPSFWPERVARARSHPESAGYLPADASPYDPLHNIEVAALLIWESRETLIGNLSHGSPWADGPQPFGHWDSTSRYCAEPPLVWP